MIFVLKSCLSLRLTKIEIIALNLSNLVFSSRKVRKAAKFAKWLIVSTKTWRLCFLASLREIF